MIVQTRSGRRRTKFLLPQLLNTCPKSEHILLSLVSTLDPTLLKEETVVGHPKIYHAIFLRHRHHISPNQVLALPQLSEISPTHHIISRLPSSLRGRTRQNDHADKVVPLKVQFRTQFALIVPLTGRMLFLMGKTPLTCLFKCREDVDFESDTTT